MWRRRAMPALPPAALIDRVTGTDDPEVFLESGRRSLDDIRRVLALVHVDISGRVLDFGCGCGRVLRHLRPSRRDEIHAVDTDREAIEWVAANLRFVQATCIEPLPPMPFADETFDLVVNHSVLSHLPEDYQDAWLAELRRVTRPGGLVELTVHGAHAFGLLCVGLERDGHDTTGIRHELEEHGFVHVRDGSWEGTFADYYQNSYHLPGYIFDRWSQHFDVKAVVLRGALDFQDVVLLERRADR